MDAGSQRVFLLQVKEHIAIIPTVPIGKAETLTLYGYKHNELTKTGYRDDKRARSAIKSARRGPSFDD